MSRTIFNTLIFILASIILIIISYFVYVNFKAYLHGQTVATNDQENQGLFTELRDENYSESLEFDQSEIPVLAENTENRVLGTQTTVPTCTANDIYGLNIDLKGANGTPTVADLLALGVCNLRIELHRDFDFTPKLAEYRAANMNILAILDYALVADELTIAKKSQVTLDAYFEKYYATVTDQLTKYADYVDSYEIWNEADLGGSDAYQPYLAPTRYAAVAVKVAEIIRAKDSTAKIIVGGLAAGNTAYLQNMKNALPSKNFAKFDYLSIHPYGRRANNYPSGFGFGDFSAFIDMYTPISGNLPIIISEFGYQSYTTADWDTQGEYVKQFYREVERIPIVKQSYYFAFSDDMVNGFGLRAETLTKSGTGIPKPSYTKYSEITRELNYTSFGNIATPLSTGINVRSDAGSSYPVVYTLSNLNLVNVTALKRDALDRPWIKINFNVNGKIVEGWAARWLFVEKTTDNTPTPTYITALYTTGNVRSGPGTANAIISKTNPNVKTTLLSKSTLSNGEVWYYIKFVDTTSKTITGWAIDYLFAK